MKIYVAKILKRTRFGSQIGVGHQEITVFWDQESFHVKEKDAYSALANYMNKMENEIPSLVFHNDDYDNPGFLSLSAKYHTKEFTDPASNIFDFFAVVKEIEVQE